MTCDEYRLHVITHKLTISCLAFYLHLSRVGALCQVPVELGLGSEVRGYHSPRYLSLVLACCISELTDGGLFDLHSILDDGVRLCRRFPLVQHTLEQRDLIFN